jgi:hypothetical protein
LWTKPVGCALTSEASSSVDAGSRVLAIFLGSADAGTLVNIIITGVALPSWYTATLVALVQVDASATMLTRVVLTIIVTQGIGQCLHSLFQIGNPGFKIATSLILQQRNPSLQVRNLCLIVRCLLGHVQ